MAKIQSGATADELTIDAASKAARVTLYDVNGIAVNSNAAPASYRSASGVMSLGTLASNSCFLALNNPVGSGKNLYIVRANIVLAMVGNTANTIVPLGMVRGTGTPAGGTGNKSGANIARRNPADAASIAQFYYGPAAITGLTDDAVGDVRSVMITNQNAALFEMELLGDIQHKEYFSDATIVPPGYSWCVRNRATSNAGSTIAVNLEWIEAA
jgi:hypothetical protein